MLVKTLFFLGIYLNISYLTAGLSNQEISFSWNAQISAGSLIPASLTSKWTLSAQLILQPTPNITIMQLRNVKADRDMDENHRALLLPFHASYTEGLLMSMAVSTEDVEWSVNIKRAIASLIQLDFGQLKFGAPAFLSEESGIYGKCKTEYIVEPLENNLKRVKKILNMLSCGKYPSTFWSSSPKFICSNFYQSEIVGHSEREYVIDLDSTQVIKNISARGSLFLQPYQSQAEAHHSQVNQTLVFESIAPLIEEIKTTATLNPVDMFYKDLSLDATYGKPPSNRTMVLLEIMDMLGELSDSLWWEVGSRGLNNETVFDLLNQMWWLELADWEKLYQMVTLGTSYQQETMQHLFWELVPEVGSAASALFVRDLVKSERILGLVAGRLLVNFPFYQRHPTEELLIQCEEFLRWTSPISKDVRNSGILSFATLIHKTCLQGCKADTIDRYAKLYLDKFTDSEDYEERMLYLQGLSNIDLPQSLDYLAPIIVGQPPSNHHLQFLATWAVLNSVYTNPNKVFELFWPLLNNRSQTLEVRVAAMTMVILSKPSPDRFISLYWYMQSEPSLQLYNYYYTTVKSLASTTYPCYSQLGLVASQLSRFVQKKSSVWATGNYLLDYEDKDRGYGGLLQLLLIGSERTGLPNVFIFMTEQHSLGTTTSYVLYIKLEGVGEGIKQQLRNMTTNNVPISFKKIADLLKTLKTPIQNQENVHMEFIFKIDGRTVITQYLNSSTFQNISTVVKRLSSVYFEFSVNYQRLMFPLVVVRSQPTDVGLQALVQMRRGTLLSARGSVSQDDEGRARNTELDLRYSSNVITNLQVYSPFSNKWYGATRGRSLHIRLPFAVQLHLDFKKDFYKIKTIQHRDYMAGSRLGVVWHASTNLISSGSSENASHIVKEEWTAVSQDLGARLGASVFDCPKKSTVSDALHLLKKAFLTKEKNYQMVPGGVVLLGLFSLKEHLAFQPPGSKCGVMLSLTPLLSQVEPVLMLDKNQLKLQMSRKDGLLWEIQAGFKKKLDGNKELFFKLNHMPSASGRTSPTEIWQVITFEGAFLLPSSKASVFHPPAPLTGYAVISWGDSSPTRADRAAVVECHVDAAHNEDQSLQCSDYTPTCLQSISEQATQQVANLTYVNLPGWLKTAAHALFPEHIQTESSSTRVGFSSSTSLPPWNTKGMCAVDSNTVLTIDNTTMELSLTSCFTLLVADCSQDTTFAVLLKKMSDPDQLAVKLYAESDVIELLPSTNGNIDVFINENIKLNPIMEDYKHGGANDTVPKFSISVKQGSSVEVELSSGVVVQHYAKTVVTLIPGVFRGYTCGLCGDFNSDTSNEPVMYYTQC